MRKLRVGTAAAAAVLGCFLFTSVAQAQPGQPPPPPPPSQSTWTANYWNNMDFSGNAVLARNEGAINHEWGYGSPAPGVVPNDHFSCADSRPGKDLLCAAQVGECILQVDSLLPHPSYSPTGAGSVIG